MRTSGSVGVSAKQISQTLWPRAFDVVRTPFFDPRSNCGIWKIGLHDNRMKRVKKPWEKEDERHHMQSGETPIQWQKAPRFMRCGRRTTGADAGQTRAPPGNMLTPGGDSLFHARRTWEEIQWGRWVGWGYSLRCVAAALPADETCYAHAEIWPSPHSLGLSWWETSSASQISLVLWLHFGHQHEVIFHVLYRISKTKLQKSAAWTLDRYWRDSLLNESNMTDRRTMKHGGLCCWPSGHAPHPLPSTLISCQIPSKSPHKQYWNIWLTLHSLQEVYVESKRALHSALTVAASVD